MYSGLPAHLEELETDQGDAEDADKSLYYLGVAVAILGALITSMMYVSVKKIGKDLNTSIPPLYYGVATCIMGTIYLTMIGYAFFSELNWFSVGLLLLNGVFSWIQQESTSMAF